MDAAGQRPRLCLPSLGTKLFPGHSNDGAAIAPKHSSAGVKYGGSNPLVNGSGGTSCVGERMTGGKNVFHGCRYALQTSKALSSLRLHQKMQANEQSRDN